MLVINAARMNINPAPAILFENHYYANLRKAEKSSIKRFEVAPLSSTDDQHCKGFVCNEAKLSSLGFCE